MEVQSLARGPGSVAHALESPLWTRALVSSDQRSSFISVIIREPETEALVPKIEDLKKQMDSPGSFELMISGSPYIVEIIRRNLLRDLKVFSLVALAAFAVAIFALFRSLPILLGTIISCMNVAMWTLIATQLLNIKTGPLTSNLSVIVFVLALNHIIFITFNWIHVSEKGGEDSASEAVRITLLPSFWSMVTQLLGFASLLFVKATPLRQLGIAGTVGTLIAFGATYLIYPAFLRLEAARRKGVKMPDVEGAKRARLFDRPHAVVASLILAAACVAGAGIHKLNTDPSLFSFFKKGGELRNGMEYIDANGGSTPLKIVVSDSGGSRLDTEEAYERLSKLHFALERDPAVGNVISLPIVLAEAKLNPLAKILPVNWLVGLLESPRFGKVAKYFITPDRQSALFMLRMREAGRELPRMEIVERVEGIVRDSGFKAAMTGGVYLLQGKLSELVVSSTLEGLFLLVVIFTLIAGFIARSARVGAAIFASLCAVPFWAVGLMGWFRVPFDVISSPGINIAIGIGVDSMINMLFFVKRHSKNKNVWAETCSRMWKPVLYSTLLICLGFGIFILSTFPPTQRFGLSVILGTAAIPLVALFVFPWIASGAKIDGNR